LHGVGVQDSATIQITGNRFLGLDDVLQFVNASSPIDFWANDTATCGAVVSLGAHGDDSGLLWKDQTVTFTPAVGGTGWYRVLSYLEFVGGELSITAPKYDNSYTDVGFAFDSAGYGNTGQINQTRFSPYNAGVISQARVGSIGGQAMVDVYLSKATSPQPITIAYANTTRGLLMSNPPTYNPTAPSSTSTLTLASGFNTTGGAAIGGNLAVFGTDIHLNKATGSSGVGVPLQLVTLSGGTTGAVTNPSVNVNSWVICTCSTSGTTNPGTLLTTLGSGTYTVTSSNALHAGVALCLILNANP
jgi:hypothetical protein